MSIVALPAHYDGERICLDEEYDLKPYSKLIVTILPEDEPGSERESWLRLSGQRLSEAYGDDEPEYPFDLLIEVNPSHETR